MSGYSRVVLLGNLTRKPEVRFLQSGTAVVKTGLAINRKYKGQDGEMREEATFVDLTFFGKRGEAFAKWNDKGGLAFIEGELRLDTWDDKQSGEKRSKLYVVGTDWHFVGGKRESGGGREASSGDAGYGVASGGFDAGDDATPF
jgi:single-strand DNA-binding protein